MMKKLTVGLSLAAYLLANPVVVLAQNINLGPPTGFGTIPSNVNLATIIGGVLQMLLLVAAVFFFVYLVIGGIKWIMSGGDKTKVEAARNQITHALIGLVVVFGAWIIASLVKTILGIDIFNPPIPNFQGSFTN